jgi:hypothetical protein
VRVGRRPGQAGGVPRPAEPGRQTFRRVERGCALLGVVALLVTPVAAYSPEVDYALECEGCHRADGAGTPGSVPALAGNVGRFLHVPGGREFLVQVPGVAQAPLDDAAVAGVLNFVVGRFGGPGVPADFVPYGAAEVGRLRRAPLLDVVGTRRRLLGE